MTSCSTSMLRLASTERTDHKQVNAVMTAVVIAAMKIYNSKWTKHSRSPQFKVSESDHHLKKRRT